MAPKRQLAAALKDKANKAADTGLRTMSVPSQDIVKVLDQGLTDAQQDKVVDHIVRLMAKPRGTHERFKD